MAVTFYSTPHHRRRVEEFLCPTHILWLGNRIVKDWVEPKKNTVLVKFTEPKSSSFSLLDCYIVRKEPPLIVYMYMLTSL